MFRNLLILSLTFTSLICFSKEVAKKETRGVAQFNNQGTLSADQIDKIVENYNKEIPPRLQKVGTYVLCLSTGHIDIILNLVQFKYKVTAFTTDYNSGNTCAALQSL